MPYPKNKYRKGWTIRDLDTLFDHLKRGRYVYLRGKVTHPGFILRMTFSTAASFIEDCQIFEAIDQQKEYYANRRR